MRRCAAVHDALTIARPREVTVDVPVQYFQSVIALETAVTGVLLFQIRFFATGKDAPEESDVHPRLRVLLLAVLTATVFGSLEAIREGRGRWSALLVTVGLAVSVLPILLRVLPPAATRCADPAAQSALLGHRARPRTVRGDRPADRRPPMSHNLTRLAAASGSPAAIPVRLGSCPVS